ncbi:MAG: tetratricopeptide repeat protein [Phycisphaerales bacterium]
MTTEPSHHPRLRFVLWSELRWALLPIGLAIALFVGTISGDFVYDDHLQIQSNTWIRDPAMYAQALRSDVAAFSSRDAGPASAYWRPTFVVWMIMNYRLFGVEDASGWRAGNVVLHAMITGLAFALCRRLGLSRVTAAAVACIFAAHPSRCENVSWASGVTDLLCAAPLLGALLLILPPGVAPPSGEPKRRYVRWTGALTLYAVALGAKEVAVLFPMIALAAGLRGHEENGGSLLNRAALRRALLCAAPFAALAGVYLIVRNEIVGGVWFPVQGAPDFVTTLKTLPLIGAFYLKQAIVPWPIGPMYPVRPVTGLTVANFVVPLLLLILMAAGVVWAVLRVRSRGVLVGAALMFFPLLPALNIGSFLPEQLVHDRYLYLPLLGLLVFVLSVIAHLAKRTPLAIRVSTGVAFVACVPLCVQTIRYNSAWMTDAALWEWAVNSDPSSAFSHTQRGIYLMTDNRLPEARAAFERAMAIQPTTRVKLALADLDVRQDHLADAEARLLPMVDQPPADMAPLELFAAADLLGRIWLERDDDVARALALYRETRSRLPAMTARITDRIGMILSVDERPDEAIAELESARSTVAADGSPQARMLLLRLGQLYAQRNREGDHARAIPLLQEFLRLTVDSREPGVQRLRDSAAATLRSIR